MFVVVVLNSAPLPCEKCAVRALLCVLVSLMFWATSHSLHFRALVHCVDRDPPVCHDVHGDIMTVSQPAAALSVCWSGWSVVVCGTCEVFR